jgi:hypothetical protein
MSFKLGLICLIFFERELNIKYVLGQMHKSNIPHTQMEVFSICLDQCIRVTSLINFLSFFAFVSFVPFFCFFFISSHKRKER